MKRLYCLIMGMLLYEPSFAQLVKDGNFEYDTPFTDPVDIAQQYKIYNAPGVMGAWEVTGGSIDKHNKVHWSMGCPPGGMDHHIDLNPNGAIRQVVRGLTDGKKYELTFYTSVHRLMATGCGSAGGTSQATVTIGTTDPAAVLTTNYILTGADAPWTKQTITYTATADTAILVFRGTASCYVYGGVLIDEIVMEPVCPDSRFVSAGKDTSVCLTDGKAEISLNASGAVTYLWSPSGFFTDPAKAAAMVSVSTTTTFVVEGEDALGCKDRDTVVVTVWPSPVADAGPDDTLCVKGGTAQVQLHAIGGTSYSWSPAASFTQADTSDPVTEVSGTAHFIVQVRNNYGCADEDTVTISVFPIPALTTDTVKPVCAGDTVHLSVTGADTYSWSPLSGLYNAQSNKPYLVTLHPARFIVEGKNQWGCAAYDTVDIAVAPRPDIAAYVARNIIDCDHESVQLLASGGVKYTWAPATYFDDSAVYNPFVSPLETTMFTLTGWNEYGCSNTDTITIFRTAESVIRMPNVFTPNADGLNDGIKPIIVCDFVLSEFLVYDRWGEQLFATSDPSVRWDGTFKGKPCELGVYFYLITGRDHKGKRVMLKGDVTLIR